jgi:hypothetical protein
MLSDAATQMLMGMHTVLGETAGHGQQDNASV